MRLRWLVLIAMTDAHSSLKPLEQEEILETIMAFYDMMNEGSPWETLQKRVDYRYQAGVTVNALAALGFRVSKSPKLDEDGRPKTEYVYGICYNDRNIDNYSRSRFSEEYGVWLSKDERDAKIRELNQHDLDRCNEPGRFAHAAAVAQAEQRTARGILFQEPVPAYVPRYTHDSPRPWIDGNGRAIYEYYGAEDIEVNFP